MIADGSDGVLKWEHSNTGVAEVEATTGKPNSSKLMGTNSINDGLAKDLEDLQPRKQSDVLSSDSENEGGGVEIEQVSLTRTGDSRVKC